MKRWERAGEIARPEGGEAQAKSMSGTARRMPGGLDRRRHVRVQGSRSGEAIGSGGDMTRSVVLRRWTSEHLDAPHGTASTVGTAA